MNKEEIQARIKELQKRMDALPNWGAAVGAMWEEQQSLQRQLRYKEKYGD